MSGNAKKIEGDTLISSESCEFRWSIKNFNVCGLQGEEHLTSPEFKTGQSSPTTWRLLLYPCRLNKTKEDNVEVYLKLCSKDSSAHYAYFKLSIIDSSGLNKHSKECYHLYTKPNECWGWPSFIKRKVLFGSKELYLPQNILTIMCELTTSKVDDYKTSPLTKLSLKPTSSSGVFKKPDSLISDLQQLYNSKMLSDFTLKAGDEEFKAHKIILCARSSVFNTMLNCEMEEKLTNSVKITDFDPPTVRKMLRYIYCGVVEDLTPEVALQLYSAAEKYNLQV